MYLEELALRAVDYYGASIERMNLCTNFPRIRVDVKIKMSTRTIAFFTTSGKDVVITRSGAMGTCNACRIYVRHWSHGS